MLYVNGFCWFSSSKARQRVSVSTPTPVLQPSSPNKRSDCQIQLIPLTAHFTLLKEFMS